MSSVKWPLRQFVYKNTYVWNEEEEATGVEHALRITLFLPQLKLGLLIAWEILLVMWKLRNKEEFRN